MAQARPLVLSIGGFDPSGGAGIGADLKTFEKLKVYGLSVLTANTLQHEDKFMAPGFVNQEMILKQLSLILEKHRPAYVKIGLIENTGVLKSVLGVLKTAELEKRIIWDPVMKAGAGFDFHDRMPAKVLNEILPLLLAITPNYEEAARLGDGSEPEKNAEEMGKYCAVILKGGHNPTTPGKDFLFYGGNRFSFNPGNGRFHFKHGSGCVFAAALTAFLARGFTLNRAVLRAKRYTEKFLASAPEKLGFHS